MPGSKQVTQNITLNSNRQMGCVTATDYDNINDLMMAVMRSANEFSAPAGWDIMQLEVFPITIGGNTKWSGFLCFIFDKDQ